MARSQAKKIRKSIRIGGKLLTETFTSKVAANEWYRKQFDRKKLEAAGIVRPVDEGVLFQDFALGEFMEGRRKNYPQSTWASDEQRLRDYLLPELGATELSKISTAKVRAVLAKLVTEHGLSPNTRDRVRALVSAIFNEALNREGGPLVLVNPTFGIGFGKGKRKGTKEPSFLHTNEEGVRYFLCARNLSSRHLVIGGLGLNGGLRKQEMIALRWSCIDYTSKVIEVREKYEQVSKLIKRGTKNGEETTRFVPMSSQLEDILRRHFAISKFKRPDDFILTNADGSNLNAKELYNLHMETCRKAKVKVTVHGLRHTFGREFAAASDGNVGALKDILGHSNIMVTQRYSTLGKERLKGFRDVVNYGQIGTDKDDN